MHVYDLTMENHGMDKLVSYITLTVTQ